MKIAKNFTKVEPIPQGRLKKMLKNISEWILYKENEYWNGKITNGNDASLRERRPKGEWFQNTPKLYIKTSHKMGTSLFCMDKSAILVI